MANEKRLIDANEALRIAKEERYMWVYDLTDLEEFLTEVPTVDAVEVVHGYWIERPLDDFRKYEVKCSECGFTGVGNYDQYLEPCDFNYCPNCSAKMDGGNEDA